MTNLITLVHILVCVALIMIVLLQTGKGADMGAAFGGGSSQTLFGSSGAGTFLSRATTVAAVVFMVTCLMLAYISSHRSSGSIVIEEKPPIEETAPVTDKAATPKPAEKPTETKEAPKKSPITE